MKNNYIFLISLLFTACAPVELTPSAFDIQTAIAETVIAEPVITITGIAATATIIPNPTETPIPEPIEPTREPVFAQINVAYLNLRVGPGTLFDVLGTFEEKTEVKIIGHIKDSFWTNVSIFQEEEDLEIFGWMSGDLLDIELTDVPILDFPLDQTIKGKINLTSGEAIDNISVTFTHRANEVETRHVEISNSEGVFVVYYPIEMVGLFDIQITGILCISSIMNDNCELINYFNLGNRIFISIPQEEEIQFYYETSTTDLTGKVLDKFGNPVADIMVAAERDDGAESSSRSKIDGEFSIPVGAGIWEVYALVLYPRNEGERISVNITDQIPSPIELIFSE